MQPILYIVNEYFPKFLKLSDSFRNIFVLNTITQRWKMLSQPTYICGSSSNPTNSTADYEQNRKQTVYFICYDKFDNEICRRYIVAGDTYALSVGILKWMWKSEQGAWNRNRHLSSKNGRLTVFLSWDVKLGNWINNTLAKTCKAIIFWVLWGVEHSKRHLLFGNKTPSWGKWRASLLFSFYWTYLLIFFKCVNILEQ